MHKEYLMGNEAIALGAIAAGVNLVAGYPGTPSTEVLETVAKNNSGSIYVEWSVNEKAALEVAAGASYSGARTLVTMKQVGLNVASDPLMCLEYVGVEGGMVVLVADDPGPISSQTEQDTRRFASYSNIPCFDPSSPQEAYDMIQDAFEYSSKYKTPVLLRPTTRVCHGYSSIEIKDKEEYKINTPEGFKKDTSRWVIFPKLSNANHAKIEERNVDLSDVFSGYEKNFVVPSSDSSCRKAIVTHGINFTYTMEALKDENAPKILKISTPFPFPEKLVREFLLDVDEVLCIEELSPVLEQELLKVCGKYGLCVKVRGKLTGDVKVAGENTIDEVKTCISTFMGSPKQAAQHSDDVPALPVRPPVLCAGCPHRASFYAVKKAMRGKKSIFCGDIGCYTLGNAQPLDMTDTCLCMGAGITMAQGFNHIDPEATCFAFEGDSTFFASAITGIVNGVYNQANMIAVILDNSTTAMTGHQPHPGTGRTMMGDIVDKINIEAVLKGIGVTAVETVNPFELDKAVECVKRMSELPGVKAIIFKSPCIALSKPTSFSVVDNELCTGCKNCINQIGCPALSYKDGKAVIADSLCCDCGLCANLCHSNAIKGGYTHG